VYLVFKELTGVNPGEIGDIGFIKEAKRDVTRNGEAT
jgi:hypothetical protein